MGSKAEGFIQKEAQLERLLQIEDLSQIKIPQKESIKA